MTFGLEEIGTKYAWVSVKIIFVKFGFNFVLIGVRGKRRRSSPTCLEQIYSGKRRSTRARNTARKEEPTLARTLSKLIPPPLL